MCNVVTWYDTPTRNLKAVLSNICRFLRKRTHCYTITSISLTGHFYIISEFQDKIVVFRIQFSDFLDQNICSRHNLHSSLMESLPISTASVG